ncbi:MAG: bifunctional DNA-formamidopyrimidine glycosylase/DNA-(apurinic or apyrimidinic site) lyase [Candidatus Zixiibacteriota bacterium]
MPELPEVETIVQGLRKSVIGKRIKSAYADGCRIFNQKNFCKGLVGNKIKSVSRRGKFIILELSDNYHLLIHLGMTGGLFHQRKGVPKDKHDHLILKFTDSKTELRYNDQRKFGRIRKLKTVNREPKTDNRQLITDLSQLGCEPLEISANEFVKLVGKRKGRIKPLLLNQTIIAGIGNIYSDEALFEARIHPLTPANRISKQKLKKLHKAIQQILKKAILAGGSSVDNYTNLQGERGFFQLEHKVYAREGEKCKRCGTKIKRIRITQRSTHFCPKCQNK